MVRRTLATALLLATVLLALIARSRSDAAEAPTARDGKSLHPRGISTFSVSISPSNPVVGEDAGALGFTVSLVGCTNPQDDVFLVPGTVSAEDIDVSTSGFFLGESALSAPFSIDIIDDQLDEGESEAAFIFVSEPTNGVFEITCDEGELSFSCQQPGEVQVCATSLRQVTIVDNDEPTPTPTLTPTPSPTPPPTSCEGAATLSCASGIDGGNNGDNAGASSFNSYSCLVSSYPGPDFSYEFAAPNTGTYVVTLSGPGGPDAPLGKDLDLVVVEGTGQSCGASDCIGASDRSGADSESVTFTAEANQQFLIVVDSRTAATAADFRIELTCPNPPQAKFQRVPLFPTVGEPVAFYDVSTGFPTQRTWDFGDSSDDSTSTLKNPIHEFENPGTFTVSLEVENSEDSDTHTEQVTVAPANGEIEIDGPSSGNVGAPLVFQANAAGCVPAGNGWEWLTAGGVVQGNGSGNSVTMAWASPGLKTVSVTNVACGSALGSTTLLLERPNVTPPTSPGSVTYEAVSSTEVVVSWQDRSSNEDGFRVDRLSGAEWIKLGAAPANETSLLVSLSEVPFTTTLPTTLRVVAFNAIGESPEQLSTLNSRALAENEVEVTTEPDSCDSERALCLLQKRFRIEASWIAPTFAPGQGIGHAVSLTEDTGYFWFFNPENVELVLKVLDGRAITGSYWVFFGALSNVEYSIRVTDTVTGNVKEYNNPQGQFASIGDTSALPPEGSQAALIWHPAAGRDSFELVRAADAASLVERATSVDFAVTPEVGHAANDMLFEDLTLPPSAFRARSWRFGDNTPPLASQELMTRYSFAEPGTYDVTLEVLDLSGDFYGLPDAVTKRVDITPPLDPALRPLTTPPGIQIGQRVTFSAAAEETCSPAFRGWKWDVGGGQIIGHINRPTIDVTWSEPGVKTVTVSNSRCRDAVQTRVVEVVANEAASAPVERAGGAPCQTSDTDLCLVNNRFALEVAWKDFGNKTGVGHAERVSAETGYFWFFNEDNVELIIKVLDGRAINGNYWVFYGALSNVEYTLTVTDTQTGAVRTYFNPSRNFGSEGDTSAFPGD